MKKFLNKPWSASHKLRSPFYGTEFISGIEGPVLEQGVGRGEETILPFRCVDGDGGRNDHLTESQDVGHMLEAVYMGRSK